MGWMIVPHHKAHTIPQLAIYWFSHASWCYCSDAAGQTDGWTDTRLMLYTFCYRGSSEKFLIWVNKWLNITHSHQNTEKCQITGYNHAYLVALMTEGVISSPSVRYKAYPVTAASLSPLGILETDATKNIKNHWNLLHSYWIFLQRKSWNQKV